MTTPTLQLGTTTIIDTFAEAFRLRFTRLLITAHDDHWLEAAMTAVCGYGTSVIGCDAEIGLERRLSAAESPDGRPAAAILAFGFAADSLAKAIANRVGQCLLTCPTTAVYDGLYFDGDFDLFTTDGLGDFSIEAAQVNSACDFFKLADPVETKVGTFEGMEMNCVDTDLNADGTKQEDPESQYYYAEIWSLELGMPIYQYFGVDQSTGDVDDFAMLVSYQLN